MYQQSLPLDHEPSLNHWAKVRADFSVETGECSNWDHAYESAWSFIETISEDA